VTKGRSSYRVEEEVVGPLTTGTKKAVRIEVCCRWAIWL